MNFAPRVSLDPYLVAERRKKNMTKRAEQMTEKQLDASIRDYSNNFRARGHSEEFIEGLWYMRLLRSLKAKVR